MPVTEQLPSFTYHPDPVRTGAVAISEITCACCQRARGAIYVGPIYGGGADELHERLCPWCIADGTAAKNFGASFADSYPLARAGVPQSTIDEIHLRTPGYVSWQQDSWLSHCNDACEFHGDASIQEVQNAAIETKKFWMTHYQMSESDWVMISTHYTPGGTQALYKFVCRQCSWVLFGWDCS